MRSRTRVIVGLVNHACGLCGAERVLLVESRRVRRFKDHFNIAWDPAVRTTETCPACRARIEVDSPLAAVS